MTSWLSFFIGYSVGMTLTVLIMIGIIEAKEVDKRDISF